MKRLYFIALFAFITTLSFGQTTLNLDSNGLKLRQFYLNQNVKNLWLAGHHVNWETGQLDDSLATKDTRTHCSSFVAAVCKKLGIYMLRPPEHRQTLLANAQYNWLNTSETTHFGWEEIKSNRLIKAQELANEGYVVIVVAKNKNPKQPGHIAFVIPTKIEIENINVEGPLLIQASTVNSISIPLIQGFKRHIAQWPPMDDEISFFFNKQHLN